MSRRVSSVDVARRAGVSQATVSYVLNQRRDLKIRDETRRKVLAAARDLGYQPNLAARTLVTGKTRTIALWVPNTYHSVFSHVIEQVMLHAQESRFHVVIVHINPAGQGMLADSWLLSGWNVDAILALDARGLVDEILEASPVAPPIISIGPAYSTLTDHVGVDLRGGTLQAVRHLWENGCRRVAYAAPNSEMHDGEPRYDAYMQGTREAGGKAEFLELDSGSYEGSYQAAKRRFASADYPDGLLCWNDETAIGINRALAELGRRVPEDVALIGSDGIRETAYAVPTISTMVQPFDAMCSMAWEFLQNRLNEPELPLQTAVLPMRLEKRASTQRT